MKQHTNSSRVVRATVRGTALALLLVLFAGGLSACREEAEGPLESAGEKADEQVDDAKRAVEDAAD